MQGLIKKCLSSLRYIESCAVDLGLKKVSMKTETGFIFILSLKTLLLAASMLQF